MRTDLNNSQNNEYQVFWQNNLQKLEEINIRIEKILIRLEKQYIEFDSVYDQLNSELDMLSSIYSSFNNLLGLDYLLKLKSLLNDYRKRYTHDSIRFNVLFFLHSKIKELRDESFSKFPELTHSEIVSPVDTKKYAQSLAMPFKWITFKRNGSWFITAFDSINVLKIEKVYHAIIEEGDTSFIAVNGKNIEIIDLLNSYRKENKERPNYFVFVTRGGKTSCYAVHRMGKRLFAKSDIMSKKLIKYNTLPHHAGHLRIFGNNHIYIS
ncbi:MAG TPA: hypothetical protein PK544_12085 [Spirochaetota bacterium]|nr:hypothetical protein [Spirochaetota bacterium]